MELQQVRAFLAVAEELHFGRAAERLHMAQPPVSRSVQALERELGVRLFDRSTRSVKLTAAGQALVESASQVLDLTRSMRATARAAGRGEIGQVRVAFAGASTTLMIGQLARAVRHAHPGVQLVLLSQQYSQPTIQRLVQGEIDIALGRWDQLPDKVETAVIGHEDLVLAVPQAHPLADRDSVTLEEFSGDAFVSLPPQSGSVLVDRLRSMSHRAGFAADIVQYAPDSWTLMSLVSAEVGCSLTLSSVATGVTDPHVRFLHLEDAQEPLEMRLAWGSHSPAGAVRAVIDVARTTFSTDSRESHNDPA